MLRTARLLWYWSGVAIGLVGLCAILPRGGVDVTLLGYTLTPEMRSAIYTLMVVNNIYRIRLLASGGGGRA